KRQLQISQELEEQRNINLKQNRGQRHQKENPGFKSRYLRVALVVEDNPVVGISHCGGGAGLLGVTVFGRETGFFGSAGGRGRGGAGESGPAVASSLTILFSPSRPGFAVTETFSPGLP